MILSPFDDRSEKPCGESPPPGTILTLKVSNRQLGKRPSAAAAKSFVFSRADVYGKRRPKSVRPAFELAADLGVTHLAPIHLEEMADGGQVLGNRRNSGSHAVQRVRGGELRHAVSAYHVLASEMVLLL